MSVLKKALIATATSVAATGLAFTSAMPAHADRYYSFDVGPAYAYTRAWTTAGEGSVSQAWHGYYFASSGYARYATSAFADCGTSYYYGGRVYWY